MEWFLLLENVYIEYIESFVALCSVQANCPGCQTYS